MVLAAYVCMCVCVCSPAFLFVSPTDLNFPALSWPGPLVSVCLDVGDAAHDFHLSPCWRCLGGFLLTIFFPMQI